MAPQGGDCLNKQNICAASVDFSSGGFIGATKTGAAWIVDSGSMLGDPAGTSCGSSVFYNGAFQAGGLAITCQGLQPAVSGCPIGYTLRQKDSFTDGAAKLYQSYACFKN
ncbi:MAG: hypothetical protein PHU14_15945 [Methylovulum sp.]|nr:hypothetical protein [Methylovulum sp.]